MNRQLDLFEDFKPDAPTAGPKPTCEVIAFPIDRESSLIRETARQLERKHGPAADKWWQTQCRRIFARLQVQGVPEGEARAAIDRFSRAVYAEMTGAHVARDGSHPRPAA